MIPPRRNKTLFGHICERSFWQMGGGWCEPMAVVFRGRCAWVCLIHLCYSLCRYRKHERGHSFFCVPIRIRSRRPSLDFLRAEVRSQPSPWSWLRDDCQWVTSGAKLSTDCEEANKSQASGSSALDKWHDSEHLDCFPSTSSSRDNVSSLFKKLRN